VTKVVIWKFYGRSPEKSYFAGCSTGGRMALMEAWRYPEDFDGIISGAPVMDNAGLYINFHWVARKNIGADGKDIISSNDLKLIIDAVYQACDSIDGLKDGLISDPGVCEFDPESLLCGKNENEGCLTAEQVTTLKAWYGGPKNSAGEQLYPGGLPLGSEPVWHRWITGKADAIVTPWKSIEYYKEVEQRFGGREKTQDFFRLFMIPGMDHCGFGNELGITGDSIDPLTALEKWVEEGQAPDSLLMNKYAPDGSVMWTRPVYPYPLRTVYKGEGDLNSASSYESKEP